MEDTGILCTVQALHFSVNLTYDSNLTLKTDLFKAVKAIFGFER